MPAPTFQAVSNPAGHSATTGTLPVTWPSHLTNDIAVLFVETNGGAVTPTLSTPNGFADLGTTRSTGTGTAGTKLHMFWCRATSAAMGAPVIAGSTDHLFAVMVTFRGCATTGSPFDTPTGGTKAAASTTATLSAITPTTADSLVVYGITGDLDATGAWVTGVTNSNLTSITERFDQGTISGTGGKLAVYTGVPTTAAGVSVGTATATVTSSINAFQTFTLRPIDAATTQAAFGFYEDGTESGSTIIDSANTNITRNVTSDSNLLVRLRVQESGGGVGPTTDDYQLQYSRNSGAYSDIGTGTDDSYGFSNRNSFANVSDSNTVAYGQSVTGTGTVLQSALFAVAKVGSPTGNVTVKVYAHSGTFGTSSVGTGSALATSDVIDAGTLSTNSDQVLFSFSGVNQITLVNGTRYVLVVEYVAPGDFVNYITVGTDTTSPTHSGNATSRSSGGVWTTVASTDVVFAINPLIIAYRSPSLTEGGATTNRLGAGTGSFLSGKISRDGVVDDAQLTANNFTEHLFALTLKASLSNADTLDFRVLRNGAALNTYTVTPRITVSKSAGASVTPGVASITISSFIPTVAASNHQSVTPGVRSLTTAYFAPTVTASDHKSVTPGTLATTTTRFAPTVNITNNQSVTPSVLSLTTGAFAPTVNVSNNQSVTPGLLPLTTTKFAPTVTASDNKSLTPTYASLALSAFAPTIQTPVSVNTGVIALSTAAFAPAIAVSNNQSVTPTTASLTVTRFAPIVQTPISVTLGQLALTTTSYAPSVAVSDNKSVTPSTLSLTITKFSPAVTASDHEIATPSTLSLTTNAYAPTATASDHKVVTPASASLITTKFAPVVTASDHKVAAPGTVSLTTSSFAPTIVTPVSATPATLGLTISMDQPTVLVGDQKIALPGTEDLALTTYPPTVLIPAATTPSTLSLALSTYSPSITVQDLNQTVTPGALSLSLTRHAPTIQVTASSTVIPATASLNITFNAPSVTASDNKMVTLGTLSLSTSQYAPTVTLSDQQVIAPSTASLTINLHAPDAGASQTVFPSPAALIIFTYQPNANVSDLTSVIQSPPLKMYVYRTTDRIYVDVERDEVTVSKVVDKIQVDRKRDNISVAKTEDDLIGF